MRHPYIHLETFVILSVLLLACLPAAHAAIESRDVLKTYFESGDIPTEKQFINLIDSSIILEACYGESADTHAVTNLAGGIAADAAGHAQLLVEGQTFDPAAVTLLGAASVGDGSAWPGGSGFLAFTFDLGDDGAATTHAGFLQMSVDGPSAATPYAINVIGFAYETEPDTPITTFAIPEPSMVTLLAFGAVCLTALRHRS